VGKSGSTSKNAVYQHYSDMCSERGIEPSINATYFGYHWRYTTHRTAPHRTTPTRNAPQLRRWERADRVVSMCCVLLASMPTRLYSLSLSLSTATCCYHVRACVRASLLLCVCRGVQ
jgi:hypothetical protein